MPIQANPGVPLRIDGQRIVGKTLIVGTNDYVDTLIRSEFVDCTFDVVNPKALMLIRCRLINCVIRPRKEVNISIGDNYWEKCIFHGRYRSTHFGLSGDDIHGPSEWPDIALCGCDFSHAILHVCCFSRLEIDSTTFPSWPCFTVLHPQRNQKGAFVAASLPPSYIVSYSTNDTSLSAIVYHWPSLVKKLTPPLDPEAVKAALQKLDFVRL